MRLRGISIFLIIMVASVGISFPDVFQMLGAKVDIYADAEVGSAGEFHAAMRDSIRDVKDSIKIRVAKYDESSYAVDTAFKRVLAENTGLGFVSSCSAVITTIPGRQSAVVELKYQYPYPREKIVAMRAETDRKVNEITGSLITPGMSDYEKVLAVHDYVIKSSRYDRLNADSNTVPPEGHEAYGVLVQGIGVCDSYAKAMKLLLEKVGVKCLIVEGSKVEDSLQGPGRVDHAWNIVMLDGEYYHIDATWDDVSEEKDSADLVYHHFNLNDAEMQKTHIWDKSKYPPCIGTRYDYFNYNKLIAKNRDEAVSMMTKVISGREKKLLLKLADYSSTAYNIEGMIKKAAEISRLRQGISAKWIINDSLGIVDFEFQY